MKKKMKNGVKIIQNMGFMETVFCLDANPKPHTS